MKFEFRANLLGSYVLAAFDAAATRGYLSDQALQTLVNALSAMYKETGGPALVIGTQAAQQAQGSPGDIERAKTAELLKTLQEKNKSTMDELLEKQ